MPLGNIQFRMLILAHCPFVQISTKERNDSELYYLSQAAHNTSISVDERQSLYPRWNDLCRSKDVADLTLTLPEA